MNFLVKNLAKLSVACLLQLIFVSFALACMCPSGNTVGSEFTRSTNIVRATLEPSELYKIDIGETQSDNVSSLDLSTLTKKSPRKLKVQEVFKGSLQVGEVLDFDSTYRCSLIFGGVGGEYLLYLKDKPKQDELWQIPGCSKSGLFENRLADILYIRKEETVRNKTRLAGRLFYDKNAIAKRGKFHLPILANRKVYIVGEKHRFETTTDKNGVYEIYDLPAGTYKIYSENIPEWTNSVSNYDSDVIEVTKSGQYERDFKYKIVGSISKNILGADENSSKSCLE